MIAAAAPVLILAAVIVLATVPALVAWTRGIPTGIYRPKEDR